MAHFVRNVALASALLGLGLARTIGSDTSISAPTSAVRIGAVQNRAHRYLSPDMLFPFLKSSIESLCLLCFAANRHQLRPSFEIGRSLTRLPVAAKMALQSAATNGGTPGSPTPAGGASLSTMYTLVWWGTSLIRATG